MKTKTITLACTLLILGIGTAMSQTRTFEPPAVRLLPHSTQGMLRILVAHVNNEMVEVNFYDQGQLLKQDKVKPKEFKKGFIKHYDLSPLNPGNYTIKVTSMGTTITYDLELKADKKIWARYWDNFLQQEQLVALN